MIKNSIPVGPPTSVSKRKENSILGTLSDYVKSLDKKYFDNEDDFKERAEQVWRQRELRGEGSMYALLQPFDRPDIKELKDRRIDVLSFMTVTVDGEKKSVGRWCQGKVIRVYEVNIQWFGFFGIRCQMLEGTRPQRRQSSAFFHLNGKRMWMVPGEWMWKLK